MRDPAYRWPHGMQAPEDAAENNKKRHTSTPRSIAVHSDDHYSKLWLLENLVR